MQNVYSLHSLTLEMEMVLGKTTFQRKVSNLRNKNSLLFFRKVFLFYVALLFLSYMINSVSTESRWSVLCLTMMEVLFHFKTSHLAKKAKVSINIADYF